MADTELMYHLERPVEVAADGYDSCTVHQCLGDLSDGNLACGEEDDTGDAGFRRIGGEACGCVPGACAGDARHPEFPCHADAHGHAAILERPGRVHPLVFCVEFGETQFFTDRFQVVERGSSLLEGDRFALNREEFAVAPDGERTLVPFAA